MQVGEEALAGRKWAEIMMLYPVQLGKEVAGTPPGTTVVTWIFTQTSMLPTLFFLHTTLFANQTRILSHDSKLWPHKAGWMDG